MWAWTIRTSCGVRKIPQGMGTHTVPGKGKKFSWGQSNQLTAGVNCFKVEWITKTMSVYDFYSYVPTKSSGEDVGENYPKKYRKVQKFHV